MQKKREERLLAKEKRKAEKELEKAKRTEDQYDSEYDSSEEESEDDDDGLDNRVKKGICLKASQLSEDLLAYFRVTLVQKFESERKQHILVSTPVDVEFEMLVVACSVNLLTDFFSKRFKTTLEEDLQLIQDPAISYNTRLCLQNRIDLKRILRANLKICNVLLHILGRIQAEINRASEQATEGQTQGKFSKELIKHLYMGQVD